MRIAILASGSRGDVQPYIALGKGLMEAGHAVRLVTHTNFEPLVVEQGLKFWPAGGDIQEVAGTAEMQKQVEDGNFIKMMGQMAKESKKAAVAHAQASLVAAEGVELLMGGMGGIFTGVAIAEKLRIPFLQAYLLPFTATGAFPGVLSPNLPRWLGAGGNRLSHQAVRQMIWQGFRSADAAARREALDMPPARFGGPFGSPALQGMPLLYGFSPAVIPPPVDWGAQTHVTGYWFLDAAAGWVPPAELEAFLAAGPPPVYIGFGSMSNRKPAETAALAVEALQRTNQRGILASGWGGLHAEELPDSIFMLESAPHAWLLPRMAAVVHHGGAGTTGAGVRAGVPAVIVPFFGDQPFWGKRLAELGVATEPLPRKQLTAAGLAERIGQATSDKAMRARAAALGKVIGAEDGIANAVALINRVASH
jgi:UDP:flavonoid glycosyltransferase YjiC (YdhE family)